jgi:hypothetical protein
MGINSSQTGAMRWLQPAKTFCCLHKLPVVWASYNTLKSVPFDVGKNPNLANSNRSIQKVQSGVPANTAVFLLVCLSPF